jgi:SAM-dependent methyltransferase
MAFEFHNDREVYFEHQDLNASKYVIPFIEKNKQLAPGLHVLEIGCGEGGVLKSFLKRGCEVTGVDLSQSRLDVAAKLFEDEIKAGKARFISGDIYNVGKTLKSKYDLILLKDTIEHIFDQEKLMRFLKSILKEDGKVFLGFPPWQMPFGGHQQVSEKKIFNMLPYIHLLPNPVYKFILKTFGNKENFIKELLEIKETRLSIEYFEKIVKRAGYKIDSVKFFLINPIYEMKFKLKPKEQFKIISGIPYLRNFVTTTCYYLLSVSAEN